jgi:hypothetical protein
MPKLLTACAVVAGGIAVGAAIGMAGAAEEPSLLFPDGTEIDCDGSLSSDLAEIDESEKQAESAAEAVEIYLAQMHAATRAAQEVYGSPIAELMAPRLLLDVSDFQNVTSPKGDPSVTLFDYPGRNGDAIEGRISVSKLSMGFAVSETHLCTSLLSENQDELTRRIGSIADVATEEG